MRRLPALAAALLTAAAALPGAAGATTVYVEGNAVGPYPIGDFERNGTLWTGAGITQYRYDGYYVPGGEAAHFLGYCVDFLAPEITGLFDITPISAYFPDEARQRQITILLGNTTALETAATDDAEKLLIRTATQLAIWEIAEETSGLQGIETGSFRALDNPDWPTYADARAVADQYLLKSLGVWTPVAGKQAKLLYNPDLQSAVFLQAVPEPATWAMMIGGVGVAGGLLRRRRQRRRLLPRYGKGAPKGWTRAFAGWGAGWGR